MAEKSTFEFRNGTNIVFRGDLKETLCRGEDCEVMTKYPYGFCDRHLQSMFKLRIGPTTLSAVEGDGLFAFNGDESDKKSILFRGVKERKLSRFEGDVIVRYEGEELTEDEVKERYPEIDGNGPYVLKTSESMFLDAAIVRSPAALINHKRSRDANCRFGQNGVIIAKKCIRNMDELFCSYEYMPDLEKKGYSFSTF